MTILVLLFGCGGSVKDTGAEGQLNPGTTPDTTACTDDSVCGEGKICDNGLCTEGDRDNTPEEATAIFWEEDVTGVINPDGDVDWFSVTSEGNEFVRVSIITEEDTLDAVVSVYDASGHRIVYEDAYPVGSVGTYDAIAYAYFGDAGDYYIKVEDVTTFSSSEDIQSGDDFFYTLNVSSEGDGGSEPDSAQDAGLTYEIEGDSIYYPIPVILAEPGDADYTRLDLFDSGNPIYIAVATHDDGSEATPVLTLYNEAGERVLEATDRSGDNPMLLPDPLGTQYVLGVSDASGGGSLDHWAWAFVIVRDTSYNNPANTEPDDDLSMSNVVDMEDQEPDSGRWRAGFGQGRVETPEDMDIWEFTQTDEDYVHVYVGAQDYGGLLQVRVELLDATGTVLEQVDSSLGADEQAINLGPYAAGTYYVRFSAVPDAGAEGGEGYFYRFGVHATSFTVSE